MIIPACDKLSINLNDASNSSYSNLEGKTFYLRVFGCQMNEHDAERIVGTLETYGAIRVYTIEDSDITIFLTCCVREAADIRLLGQASSLKNIPSRHGKRIIAVGGCIGQRDGSSLFKQLGHIDIVFGTHTIPNLPQLLSEALDNSNTKLVTLADHSEIFTSDLPTHRDKPWHAWLSIMTGCNNFCTYCIVPYVRGREKSRPFEDIISEAERYVAEGVKEITLLGQNVNSYGTDLYGSPHFAQVLKRVGETGIERIRFATSHPKDLTDETIECFGSIPSLMPYLHLPVQSGSNRILSAMNRVYTREYYLSLIHKVRNVVPDIAISTDIIVGFPGETEEDFQQTLDLVKEVGYSQAFTFIYSKRDGTPAALIEDSTSKELIQNRFNRLVDLVQSSAKHQNDFDMNAVIPVLFEGLSKRDAKKLTGRSPKNQTVHVDIPSAHNCEEYLGKILDVRVTETRTWYLNAELIDS